MTNAKIETYIATEVRNEIRERKRRTALAQSGQPRASKIKELYWTVTWSLGLGYLHDGSRFLLVPSSDDVSIDVLRPPPISEKTRDLLCVSGAAASLIRKSPGGRLLIDATGTLGWEFTGGIHRLVRQLARAAMETHAGFPVFIRDGRLFRFICGNPTPEEVEPAEGDKFVMADASWDWYPDCQKATELVSRSGGSNIIVLNDILPLTYPGIFDRLPASNFANWMEKVVPNVDAVVAISRTVAKEFLDYITRNTSARRDLQVGWNHLGADFEVEPGVSVSKRVADICDAATPFFLSVSTLEPRKGFRIAIEAMDRLWAGGADVRYVIPGRYGWGTEALVERIRSHPEYNRRLFWLEGVTAVDLRELYKSARSLIFASVAEGFGLPIVEAAYLGLPAIASDISVFREIGGDNLSYFDVADSEGLAAQLRAALARPKSADRLADFLTWNEAAANLFSLIEHNAYQFGTSKPVKAEDISARTDLSDERI